MRAFAPVSEATRHSIVKFNVNGATVALGTVVDANGLALTKASELKKGKLTCWLATEKEVDAELIGIDEEEDVALVRVHAGGLKPIRWAAGEVAVGQWAITPGIAETPQAVGIISALPHRIRPPRALIGVQFDYGGSTPKIQNILPGLGAEKAGLKPGDLIVAVNATGGDQSRAGRRDAARVPRRPDRQTAHPAPGDAVHRRGAHDGAPSRPVGRRVPTRRGVSAAWAAKSASAPKASSRPSSTTPSCSPGSAAVRW